MKLKVDKYPIFTQQIKAIEQTLNNKESTNNRVLEIENDLINKKIKQLEDKATAYSIAYAENKKKDQDLIAYAKNIDLLYKIDSIFTEIKKLNPDKQIKIESFNIEGEKKALEEAAKSNIEFNELWVQIQNHKIIDTPYHAIGTDLPFVRTKNTRQMIGPEIKLFVDTSISFHQATNNLQQYHELSKRDQLLKDAENIINKKHYLENPTLRAFLNNEKSDTEKIILDLKKISNTQERKKILDTIKNTRKEKIKLYLAIAIASGIEIPDEVIDIDFSFDLVEKKLKEIDGAVSAANKKLFLIEKLLEKMENIPISGLKPEKTKSAAFLDQEQLNTIYTTVQTSAPRDDIILSELPLDNDPKSCIDLIEAEIKKLQEAYLYSYYDDKSKQNWLIKYNHPDIELNPIHFYEAEVQALRYLRGMFIIAQNSNDDIKNKLVAKINILYKNYLDDTEHESNADKTHFFADQLAITLSEVCGIPHKKAHVQLLMARDMGLITETHHPVCTISESPEGQITIEQSMPVKISESYYKPYFESTKQQPWLQDASKLGGLNEDENWLTKFFAANLETIKKLGVPAPSSARWLPLPANTQEVQTSTTKLTNGGQSLDEPETSLDFIRLGTLTALKIKNKEQQENIAFSIIKEALKGRIEAKLALYQENYKDIIDPDQPIDFYVNYQSLLSPITGQIKFGQPKEDNNAVFVQMAKDAMKLLEIEYSVIARSEQIPKVRFHFTQTNAPINNKTETFWVKKKIKLPLTKIKIPVSTPVKLPIQYYSEDDQIRREKIATTETILEKVFNKKIIFADLTKDQFDAYVNSLNDLNYKTEYSKSLRMELLLRLRAGYYLQQLLDGKEPYKNLPMYQRNLMMASLEFLVLGKQGCTAVGCKSAKDRTAIFAAAVKTMQENPQAMYDWETLDTGITQSISQGHHFLSMLWHSAIVKLKAVHIYYFNKLPEDIRENLTALQKFTKKLKPFKAPKRSSMDLSILTSTIDPNTVPLTPDEVDKLLKESEKQREKFLKNKTSLMKRIANQLKKLGLFKNEEPEKKEVRSLLKEEEKDLTPEEEEALKNLGEEESSQDYSSDSSEENSDVILEEALKNLEEEVLKEIEEKKSPTLTRRGSRSDSK